MLISIIGTRPQYIKVKPISDFCSQNGVQHQIWDSKQHYSDGMSDNIIKDLGLKIDYTFKHIPYNEMEFIYCFFSDLANLLYNIKNKKHVLIYGDTNTAFVTALVCHKLNIPFSHIEAGIRCGDLTVPEEVNRCYIDSTASLNFCPTLTDAKRVPNSIVAGDLEYEYLNKINPEIKHKNFGLITIHRQSNCCANSIQRIFTFIDKIPYKIYWSLHHRVKPHLITLKDKIPGNVTFIDPQPYSKMVKLLSNCKFVLSDSGGLIKTAPFFGKKVLIMRPYAGWKKSITEGYAKVCNFAQTDIEWVTADLNKRNINCYVQDKFASEIIINRVLQCI